jgi:hypothetical protein
VWFSSNETAIDILVLVALSDDMSMSCFIAYIISEIPERAVSLWMTVLYLRLSREPFVITQKTLSDAAKIRIRVMQLSGWRCMLLS